MISNVVLMVLIMFFLLVVLMYGRKVFSISRIIYLAILLLISVIIGARFACENWECLKNLPSYFDANLQSVEGEMPDNCKNCTVDWNLREGIDEAALILFGIFVFFLTLYAKNINIRDFINKISKITLPGLELELLEKNLEKYEKINFKEIEKEVAKKYSKIQQKVIKQSSNNDERLILISSQIEKILKEIYIKNMELNNTFIPSDVDEIVSRLSKSGVLSREIALLINDYNKIKTINAIRSNGKKTLGLIEVSERILKLLLSLMKQFFKGAKIFYGTAKDIKIDRVKIESVSIEEVVVCAIINIIDENKNYFPIEELVPDNFLVTESLNQVTNTAKIDKVIPFNVSNTKLRMILLIDCSGSMKSNEKLNKSKEAAIQMIHELSKFENLDYQIMIYKITDENGGFIDNNGFWFKANDPSLPLKIRSLKAEGATPLWDSLNKVINFVCQPNIDGYKIIVCLTDGKNEIQGLTEELENAEFETLRDIVQNSEIPIISIGFGQEDYSKMIQLSMISGAGSSGVGSFVGVSPKDLKGIFDNIVFSITKAYRIYWKPTFREKDKTINVNLGISFKTKKGDTKLDNSKFTYKLP